MAIKFLNTVQVDTDVLYVDAANDRVGIGTASPQVPLHIDIGTNDTGILVESSDTYARIVLKDQYGEGAIAALAANLLFSIGGSFTEMMRLNGGGNLGVGQTSPTERLTVSQGTDNAGIKILSYNNATGTEAALKFSTAASANLYEKAAIIARNAAGSFGRSDMHFALDSAADALNVQFSDTKMTILNGGNVGIGITDPSQTLEVKGTVQIKDGTTSYLYLQNVNNFLYGDTYGNTIIRSANNFRIQTKTGGGESIRVNSAGDVGIGTTSPTVNLQVHDASSSQIKITNGLATPVDLQLFASSSSYAGIGTASDHRLAIRTNNTEKVTVLSNGNVGIGTVSPSKKLEVVSNTTYDGIQIKGSSIPTLGIIDTTNNAKFIAYVRDSDATIGMETNHPLTINTNNTERMRIDASGNVGIGTTSPQEKVHVSGSSNIRLEVEATDSTVAALKLTNTAGSYASFVDASGSLSTYDYNAASTRTTLLANGNLGIGTTTPSAKLDVVQATTANGAAALHLIGPNTNPNLTSSVLIIEQSDGKKITMDGNDIDVSSGDLFINDYSGEDVTFGGQIKVKGLGSPVGDSYIANGNFGVGTTSPGAKLDVRGSLRVDSVQLFSGSTQYMNISSYSGTPFISTGSSGGVINFGAPSSNTTNVYVQGTVEARDGLLGFVPTFVHGGFYHSSSSSSSAIYWIPSNYISETTSTQYYNRFVAPYPGRVKKVIMRWTNGTTPTATSVTFRKTQNGSVSSVQFPATVTGGATTSMVATKDFASTDFTFNAGDKYGIGFTTDGGTRFLYGMTYTLVIEYDI